MSKSQTRPTEPSQEQTLEASLRTLAALKDSFESESGMNRPIAESTGDVVGHDFEDTDVAQVLSERETSGTLVGLLTENREQVEHALERMAEGQYGVCEDCQRPIDPERLRFFSAATRCVACQANWDRLNRGTA